MKIKMNFFPCKPRTLLSNEQVEDDARNWSITCHKHKLTVRNLCKCVRLHQKENFIPVDYWCLPDLKCLQKQHNIQKIRKMFTKTEHKKTAPRKHQLARDKHCGSLLVMKPKMHYCTSTTPLKKDAF
jgi:hypothetical protein